MGGEPAARVTDPFGHTLALPGALVGLAVGAAVGVAILATGGLGLLAVGAALATTGGLEMAGATIGQTIAGPPTGTLATGSADVVINALQATMVTLASGPCAQESGAVQLVATGASTVLINRLPAARVSEKMTCSAVILKGSPNVLIGGPSVQVLPMEPEVPALLSTTMNVVMWAGLIAVTGGLAAGYGGGVVGWALASGRMGLSLGVGYLGSEGARTVAARAGLGPTGQTIAGIAGGVAGSALGAGLSFKGSGRDLRASEPLREPPTNLQEPFAYSPRKIGQTEPGAVPNTPELQAEMDAAATVQGKSAEGYPDLPADKAATFGDGVRPWNGDEHPGGVMYRVIGSDDSANGGYWQGRMPSSEGQWRAESAVRNEWNGDGGATSSPTAGLRGWIGPARPQMSSDKINVLPGQGEQIWVVPGSASPGKTFPPPWAEKK